MYRCVHANKQTNKRIYIRMNERKGYFTINAPKHSENVFISHAKFNQNFRSKIEN